MINGDKMSPLLFVVLLLLLVKHWYIDFVNQTTTEVVNKGVYGSFDGLMHSIKQGVGTAVVLVCFVSSPVVAVLAALFDFVVHYHVDWIKSNYGCKDMMAKAFWSHLGFDQLLHQITYLVICFLL